MNLVKLCKNLNKLIKILDSIEEKDGYTIIKTKGNVVIESQGHMIVGSKDGCLITSHPLTFINPINGIHNTESTKLVGDSIQTYLNKQKYKLNVNKEVKQWHQNQLT